MDEAIRQVLATDPRVGDALVFGLHATGRSTAHSDIDVAIGSRTGGGFDRRAIGELASLLESPTGRTIDIVVLDDAPPGLAYRVFRDGCLVVESEILTLVPEEWLADGAAGARPADVRANLDMIPAVCRGGPDADPIGMLPPRGRFRWLVSPRSTIIQPSAVHTGRTPDPFACLEHLMERVVRR